MICGARGSTHKNRDVMQFHAQHTRRRRTRHVGGRRRHLGRDPSPSPPTERGTSNSMAMDESADCEPPRPRRSVEQAIAWQWMRARFVNGHSAWMGGRLSGMVVEASGWRRRDHITSPPTALILFCSSESVDRWSTVSCVYVASSEMSTARQSPTHEM
eukprot:scaffold8303_cov30-Tisochrysis_lutea.AAC.2